MIERMEAGLGTLGLVFMSIELFSVVEGLRRVANVGKAWFRAPGR